MGLALLLLKTGSIETAFVLRRIWKNFLRRGREFMDEPPICFCLGSKKRKGDGCVFPVEAVGAGIGVEVLAGGSSISSAAWISAIRSEIASRESSIVIF